TRSSTLLGHAGTFSARWDLHDRRKSMRFRFPAAPALAVITIHISTSPLLSGSGPSSSPGQSGATAGAYLARLCGVPQLEVKNENQAAVCVTAQGDAIGLVGDRTLT